MILLFKWRPPLLQYFRHEVFKLIPIGRVTVASKDIVLRPVQIAGHSPLYAVHYVHIDILLLPLCRYCLKFGKDISKFAGRHGLYAQRNPLPKLRFPRRKVFILFKSSETPWLRVKQIYLSPIFIYAYPPRSC